MHEGHITTKRLKVFSNWVVIYSTPYCILISPACLVIRKFSFNTKFILWIHYNQPCLKIQYSSESSLLYFQQTYLCSPCILTLFMNWFTESVECRLSPCLPCPPHALRRVNGAIYSPSFWATVEVFHKVPAGVAPLKTSECEWQGYLVGWQLYVAVLAFFQCFVNLFRIPRLQRRSL